MSILESTISREKARHLPIKDSEEVPSFLAIMGIFMKFEGIIISIQKYP